MVARLKLKEIDGRAPPGVLPVLSFVRFLSLWSLRLNLTQHGETHQVQMK